MASLFKEKVISLSDMASASNINIRIVLTVIAVISLFSSCNKLDDAVDSARAKIKKHLNDQGIYERGNVPENPVRPVKGYYDIIGGAYRYITNEDRAGRSAQVEISVGDSISFDFDARIFANDYDNSRTYATNIAGRIEAINNINNQQFDTSDWSTEPERIKVGYDDILKAIQSSLPSCRAGDEVRIFLPPDVAYENKPVGVVPAKSTLVYQLTNIVIIP